MSEDSRVEEGLPTGHGAIEVDEGERRAMGRRVAALRKPESYGAGVCEVGVVDTHMSCVFLTERRAYKLKKPIRTKLIDQSTVARRWEACRREVRLNRRLAESVYLGVVPLTESDGSLRVGGEGEPVDWLVEMRRLPRERMLDRRIEAEAVSGEEIDGLADRLVAFYESTDEAAEGGEAYRSRIAEDVAAKGRALAQPRYGVGGWALAELVDDLEEWIHEHVGLLESRAGRVVDAHGDLRPEHVCLEEPPVVIDSLEFSRRLRLLDPVSELAYLGLECRRLEAGWIGGRLLGAYAEASGDDVPSTLIDFYQGYHALVRAAVAAWHLDDGALNSNGVYREKARGYLKMGVGG
jgi:aminoglycoside phosphotransferase family enzyme